MKERIKVILAKMGEGTFEREEVLALSLLSALAGESIFLLGLPGVGKSMVARRLKTAFRDAKSFEYLMSRFSTPDEIFGPVSISRLKDADSYERITSGYLPDAAIVFLDEIWKAGPAIQNALLTVLNEKTFLNGNKLIDLPIKGIISASNELPAEDEGLEALWDRFLIRYVVEPLNEKRNFIALLNDIRQKEDIGTSGLLQEEYDKIREGAIHVEVPEQIINLIFRLRERLNAKMADNNDIKTEPEKRDLKYYISDRRWKKAVGIMKTSAYLNNRRAIDLSDIQLLRHILWNEPSQISEINKIVAEETVSTLFRDILEQHKSTKRHATKDNSTTFYSPDGENYLIQCDGFQLKLKISDYLDMKASGDYYFASETTNEQLVVKEKGQYAIQVIKEGQVLINSYSYPLVTSSDRLINDRFLSDMTDTLSGLANTLRRNISDNLFVCYSNENTILYGVVDTYIRRFKNS